MADSPTPPPLTPRPEHANIAVCYSSSLRKSNSTASTGARSTRSVRVLGSHPLGSLRVLDPELCEDGGDGGGAAAPSPAIEAGSGAPTPTMTPTLQPPPPAPPSLPAAAAAAAAAAPADGTAVARHPAAELAGGGDAVIVLDVPDGFTVGVDAVSFTTVPGFRGLRNLPAGPHFLWLSESGLGLSTRSGIWTFGSGEGEVFVAQWDSFMATLGPPASQAEARIQKKGVAEVYGQLVPYGGLGGSSQHHHHHQQQHHHQPPDRKAQAWEQLSGAITRSTLHRVIGKAADADGWTVSTSDSVRSAIMPPAELELERALRSGAGGGDKRPASSAVFARGELKFTLRQDARTYDTTTVGAERTRQAIDSTAHVLSKIGDRAEDGTIDDGDLVAEMQLAFVAGAHLGNDACVRQWRHTVLRILLRAFVLPASRPRLAADMLVALAAQLRHAGSSLGGDAGLGLGLDAEDGEGEEREEEEMRVGLTVYKRRLDDLLLGLGAAASPDQVRVGIAFQAVEAAAASVLGWDLRGEGRGGAGINGCRFEEPDADSSAGADADADGEEDERGEYAPAVVELDDDGRERDRY